MFRKIIKKIKNLLSKLDQEEKNMLASVFGILFLSFLIYFMWQVRLPAQEDPAVEEGDVEEQIDDGLEQVEEEAENNNDLINQVHDYKIEDAADEIEELDRVEIFGVRSFSDFIINYKGVTHAVFQNEDNLSIDQWVEEKIIEKSPGGESLIEQKRLLDIVLERETESPIGSGIEVVRMNGYQSGELFVPWSDYILYFSYKTEGGRSTSGLENRRRELMEKIVK